MAVRGGDTRRDAVVDAGRDDRVTVAHAAEALGISKEAVRKRISRRTLRADKDPDGTVMVYVPTSGTTSMTTTTAGDRAELLQALRDEIAHLRRESERKDTIIVSLSQANAEQARTIRAIEAPTVEAPSETRETPPSPGPSDASTDVVSGPETDVDAQQGRGPVPDTGGPQEATERRWWEFWR
jgi:hypothetical protein